MPQKMALVAPLTCHAALHANLVVLGCADGSLLLVDCMTMKLDCEATCAFIPSLIRVHPDRKDGLFFTMMNDEKYPLISCARKSLFLAIVPTCVDAPGANVGHKIFSFLSLPRF